MVRVGSTATLRSANLAACSAAIMMFLLLGSTKTFLAGVAWMAERMSSVEGSWSGPADNVLGAQIQEELPRPPRPQPQSRTPGWGPPAGRQRCSPVKLGG